MKTGVRMKVKRQILVMSLFVVVFLPPQCIANMVWLEWLDHFLAMCRYILTAMAFYKVLSSGQMRRDVSNYFVVSAFLVAFAKILAMYQNGNLYLTAGLSYFTAPGFVIWNVIFFRKDARDILTAYKRVLFTYIMLHFATMLIYPKGMVAGLSNNARVWFMGNKNAVSTYVLLAVLVLYLCDYLSGRMRNRNRVYILLWLNVVLAVNASSTGHIAFMIVEAFLVLTWIFRYSGASKFIQRMIMGTSIAVILLFFVTNVLADGGTNIFGTLADILTRKGTTFSGRRAIWVAAIKYVISNPLWGIGYDAVYNAWGNGIYVYSAHNTFLDFAVKYGCIALVFYGVTFAMVFLDAFKSYAKSRDKAVLISIAVFFAMIAVSMFEALEGYHTVWGILGFVWMMANDCRQGGVLSPKLSVQTDVEGRVYE